MQDVIERDGARGGSQGDGKSSIEQRAIERCFDCRHDTATARSCTTATIAFPDGTTRKAVRYGERADAPVADRCPGCRVRAGGSRRVRGVRADWRLVAVSMPIRRGEYG
jgi:hypothetical protein